MIDTFNIKKHSGMRLKVKYIKFNIFQNTKLWITVGHRVPKPGNESHNCEERERLTLWIKWCSHGLLASGKTNGRLPQHKWCEMLLDGLKSVLRDPKACLLEHLKGCGANQDDFGMITFRLDWVKIKSDFLWTGFALNSGQASFRERSHESIWSWKREQVEIHLPVVSPKLWT